MDDHREAPRHRLLKAGAISFGGGVISCAIRNISETGAALDVASPVGIPERFILELEGSRRHCRVIWRKEKKIGVRFTRPSDDR